MIALVCAAATPATAHASGWPITPVWRNPTSAVPSMPAGPPFAYPGTANVWCPRMFTGSYGSDFFVQFQSLVNFGGTCNALWGANRPAGWVVVEASRWEGPVRRSRQRVQNSFNQHTVTAAVAHVPGSSSYVASVTVRDGQRTYYLNECFGCSG